MKKIIQSAFILTAVFLLFANNTYAKKKKTFSGTITYKITYPNSDFDSQTKAMLPKLLTYTVKGNKSRTEINTVTGKTINIVNGDEKTIITLLNFSDKKYAVKTSTEEIKKENSNKPIPIIKYSDETKTIAGYNCKKAEVIIKDNDSTETKMTVYYSKELGSKLLNFNKPLYKNINGLLMDFEINNNNMAMKFTAISVKKEKVSKKEFAIPKDYEIVTKEELKSKFGG